MVSRIIFNRAVYNQVSVVIGGFQIMNLETKRMQRVQIPANNARPTVLRCHPTRSDIVSLGLESGQVLFLKLGNQETYIMNVHEDCDEA